MRYVGRRALAAWLAALMLALSPGSKALADIAGTLAAMAEMPLEATVTCQAVSHMPLDAGRAEQLNGLLKHLSLRLRAETGPEEWSQLAILVDGEEAVCLTQRTSGGYSSVQLGQGEVFSSSGAQAMSLLLGVDDGPVTLFGLTGREATLLSDADAILAAFEEAYADRMKRAAKKLVFSGFGTGAYTQTVSVPKAEADSLQAFLVNACPDGWLRERLSGLVFSGKQTVTILYTAEGAPLRVTYAGSLGRDPSHLRDVSLTWKRLRSAQEDRDEIKLTSPAKKGSDKDTLTLTRSMTGGHCVMDAAYTAVHDRQKQSLTLSADLTLDTLVAEERLSGTLTLTHQADGPKMQLILSPQLALNEDTLTLKGLVDAALTADGANDERFLVRLDLHPLADTDWSMADAATSLDGLSQEALRALRDRLMRSAAAKLTRRLVLLPPEDVQYLSEGIDPADWARILNAASRGE